MYHVSVLTYYANTVITSFARKKENTKIVLNIVKGSKNMVTKSTKLTNKCNVCEHTDSKIHFFINCEKNNLILEDMSPLVEKVNRISHYHY